MNDGGSPRGDADVFDVFIEDTRAQIDEVVGSAKPDFAQVLASVRPDHAEGRGREPLQRWIEDARAAGKELASAAPMPNFEDVLERVERREDPDTAMRADVARERGSEGSLVADAELRADTGRARTVLAAVLAVAAAAALWAGMRWRAVEVAQRNDASAQQAAHARVNEPPSGTVKTRQDPQPPSASVPKSPPHGEIDPSESDELDPLDELQQDEPKMPAASNASLRQAPARLRSGASRPRRTSRTPVRAEVDVAELGKEAERRWKAGDREKAAELLRTITRHGRGRPVEDAYADLFVLAKQRGNGRERLQLFRRYVQRFPRGHYAEDARAGLCRAMTAEKRSACWSEYLEKHPDGSFLEEARAEAQ